MDLHKGSEISVFELKKRAEIDKNIQILDVREDSERKLVSIEGSKHIKLSELTTRVDELNSSQNIFVMCHKGIKSQGAVKLLKAKGFNYAVNVLGGIDAWSALIDRTLRRY